MLNKETAKQVIDSLPNDVSMDDSIHALYVNSKFSHGEKEIREGKRISQVDAMKKLKEEVEKLSQSRLENQPTLLLTFLV